MSDFVPPFVPLHYRFFQPKTQITTQYDQLEAGDPLCGDFISRDIMPGTYICGDEYNDETMQDWTGPLIIHADYYQLYQDKKLVVKQEKTYSYRLCFGVDSGTSALIFSDGYEGVDSSSDLIDGSNWEKFGWIGCTKYGDGGYPVETIITEEGLAVGFRIDFESISEEQYWKMVQEGIIDYDHDFYCEWF